jgi:hypothetical protein
MTHRDALRLIQDLAGQATASERDVEVVLVGELRNSDPD